MDVSLIQPSYAMVDDLAGARDAAAGRGVAGEGKERNLGFWCWGS
jgi:hypothetical protein